MPMTIQRLNQKIGGRRHGARDRSKTALWAMLALALVSAFLAAGVVATPVSAQSALPDGVTADDVNAVARQLWCPLCSGVRLDACELKACTQMKEVIAIKLSEGEDVDSIRNYFVAQYGPQVLGEPPREGFNWLAWILPVVALVIGGVFFWRRTQSLVGANQTTSAQTAAQPPTSEDDYERKLDEELAKYG